MNEEKLNQKTAILYMTRAMLDEISPSLRAIQISWDEEKIHLFFYYDGEISNEDQVSAECIGTEIIADFPDYGLEENIMRLDYPKKIPNHGILVYLRRE